MSWHRFHITAALQWRYSTFAPGIIHLFSFHFPERHVSPASVTDVITDAAGKPPRAFRLLPRQLGERGTEHTDLLWVYRGSVCVDGLQINYRMQPAGEILQTWRRARRSSHAFQAGSQQVTGNAQHPIYRALCGQCLVTFNLFLMYWLIRPVSSLNY